LAGKLVIAKDCQQPTGRNNSRFDLSVVVVVDVAAN
jgi:hypothetical protein